MLLRVMVKMKYLMIVVSLVIFLLLVKLIVIFMVKISGRLLNIMLLVFFIIGMFSKFLLLKWSKRLVVGRMVIGVINVWLSCCRI